MRKALAIALPLLAACTAPGAAGPGAAPAPAAFATLPEECGAALGVPDASLVLSWPERDGLARLDAACARLARESWEASERGGCARAQLPGVLAARREALRLAEAVASARTHGDQPRAMAASDRLVALAGQAAVPRAECR